jgi:hypothetical protein
MHGATPLGFLCLAVAFLLYSVQQYHLALFMYLISGFLFAHSLGLWLCYLSAEKKEKDDDA